MGIKRHIEDLRKEPPHVQRRYSLLYSGLVTGAIFIVWLSVLLPQGLRHDAAEASKSAAGENLAAVGSALQNGYDNAAQDMEAASAGNSDNSDISGDSANSYSAGTGLMGSLPPQTAADATDSAADSASAPQKQYDFGY
ncbi:MAG TPA: hypothetical protein VHF05_03630 [Candidatus Paceibacterota bacterium]|jgi:hypothetical protein|nr:hypothetical protein [Candidatus Paceibacterota bacterium]